MAICCRVMSSVFLNGFFITTVWGGRRFRPLEVRWTLLFVARKFQLFFAFFLKFNHYNFFKQKKQLFKILPKSNFLKPCQWNCCKVMRHSSRTGSGMTRFSLVNANFSFLFKNRLYENMWRDKIEIRVPQISNLSRR